MVDPVPALAATVANVKQLATLLDVNPRRIHKWREDGAPQGITLRAWRDWLATTGRRAIAARITEADVAAQVAISGESAPVEPEATKADDIDWKNERQKELALKARLDRQTAEGQLVPVAQVNAAFARIGATLADVLAHHDAVWNQLRAELDAAPADLVTRLRRRHDAGLAELRIATAHALRDAFATLARKG